MVWIATAEANMCFAHSGTPSDGLHAQAGVGVEAAQAAAGRPPARSTGYRVSRITLGACRKDKLMSSDSFNNPDSRTRAAVEEHWRASERGDTETEHAIYA
jgi:hypothetical protein